MELKDLREKIDRIDFKIINLLNERMELALGTAKLKKEITDEEREDKVMKNIRHCFHGLIDQDFSSKIFSEIISECKKLQDRGLKLIGFQGEHGANGELASKSYNSDLVPLSCMEFIDVFEGVENGYFDLGIVPVENSLEGAITEVNDLLIQKNLKIVGEVKLQIHHCLLTLPGTKYSEIKTVYSHPQALAQCRSFISGNKLEARPYYDTAGAAKMLSDNKAKAAAAVANKLCAELYNLEIIKENIEDNKSNFTRFVVISNESSKVEGNKCSLIFSTRHEAGALYIVLQLFSEEKVNLTRIESRPIRNNPGNYAFLLDFQGSDRDKKIKNLLKKVEENTVTFKFLGCYKEVKL